MFDTAAVVALLRWRPQGVSRASEAGTQLLAERPAGYFTRKLPVTYSVLAVFLVWLAIGLPAAFAMGTYTSTTISETGEIIGNGKLIVVKPESWIDKRFPLLPFIEDYPNRLQPNEPSLRQRLAEGEWLLVLYHHDCPTCKEAISRHEEMARESMMPQVALIEIPPYSDREALPVRSYPTQCVFGRLSNDRKWFVNTPMDIRVSDSVVTYSHISE